VLVSACMYVFVLDDGMPSVYLAVLNRPNGLLHHRGAVCVRDGDGAYRVAKDRSLQRITKGSIEGGLAGIEPVSENEFLISVWQGTMHFLKDDAIGSESHR